MIDFDGYTAAVDEARQLRNRVEAQAKEIEGLRQINLTMTASYESTITEYMKLNKELALLNRDLVGKMMQYRTIADQMGEALVITQAYLPLDKVPKAAEALTAWRESK